MKILVNKHDGELRNFVFDDDSKDNIFKTRWKLTKLIIKKFQSFFTRRKSRVIHSSTTVSDATRHYDNLDKDQSEKFREADMKLKAYIRKENRSKKDLLRMFDSKL